MICDKCIHNNVCCDEGKDEGLTFCADFMKEEPSANDFYNMLKNPITLDALTHANNKYIVLDILTRQMMQISGWEYDNESEKV